MIKVFIQGPDRLPHIRMFMGENAQRPEKDRFRAADTIAEADIVVWTGGADVNPAIYGEKAIYGTHFDPDRDLADIEAFRAAEGKLKVGICRGAQLLNVLSGGRLWQDVDRHRASHWVIDHTIDKKVYVTSTHHQQMIPSADGDIIASADLSTNKKADRIQWDARREGGTNQDVEVCWYQNSRSLCFQPHPEHTQPNNEECRQWFFDLVDFYYKWEGKADATSVA